MWSLGLWSAVVWAVPPAVAPAPPPPPPAPTWEAALERVVPAVVALRVTQARDFDDENAGTSYGTGFVVDAERGIVLTNRHMVHAGPVRAQAVFESHDEVDLIPLYRDPVHDFGFYQFDPAQVTRQRVSALSLAPDAARVGMEIRVVGNDAGEKLSILDGTLARLDREAPDYGVESFNDFNTFYLQAASNTSGGSSGSPVVDILGRVVALNAGGSTQAATSFYLPLDRVAPALAHLQSGEAVPRGTLGAVWVYRRFEEVARLAVPAEVEARMSMAFPPCAAASSAACDPHGTATGLLVVEGDIPGAQEAGVFEPGDVLESVDGLLVHHPAELEALLDARVGQSVTLVLWRGGERRELSLPVVDLHALSPSAYLELGRGIFHDVSLHQARNHGVPQQGVYVALPGYWLGVAGIPERTLIREVDGVPTPDLAAFTEQMSKKADLQRVTLRWSPIADAKRMYLSVAQVDRTWFPMRTCRREDVTGLWPCENAPAAPPAASAPAPAPSAHRAEGRLAERLAPSLVQVDFDVPYPTAGLKDFNYIGAGLVIDAERGLVVVDRDTVPVVLGDLTLTFAGAVRVPARVVWLHPVHNLAVLAYDPARLGDVPVQAATFVDASLEVGDRVWDVVIDGEGRVQARRTEISAVEPLSFGIAGTPRFRDANVEGVSVAQSSPGVGGVMVDHAGRVVAMWASFVDQAEETRSFYGLPTRYIVPAAEPLGRGEAPAYRWLGVELYPLGVMEAGDRGLPAAELAEIASRPWEEQRVWAVSRVAAGVPADAVLHEGDMVLAIDGVPVRRIAEIEAIAARPEVLVRFARGGEVMESLIPTVEVTGEGTDRLVSWAGLIVHAPHLEVASQQRAPRTGVYAAWLWYGSPAATWGLRPTRRIVEIDGQPTPDLDAFERVIAGIPDGQTVRVKSVGLDGRPAVQPLVVDLAYWPTFALERRDGAWTRREISASAR